MGTLEMELSPITGIRPLPMKGPSTDLDLHGVYDIENFARIQDDHYSPNRQGSGSGMQDELDDEEEFDEYVMDDPEEDDEAKRSVYAARIDEDRHFSFVA
jgi:hypothetical protein